MEVVDSFKCLGTVVDSFKCLGTVVDSFKCLDTVVDQKLTFTQHVDFVFKKAQQRLFLLRKLKHFGVSQGILEMVYRSLIESILAFNIVTWFGVLTVRNEARLSRVVNSQQGHWV